MAALSGNKAYITACERNKIRAEKLKYNLEKQGASMVNVMLEDAGNLSDFFSFDKILLDAPCSGSGILDLSTNNENFSKKLIDKCVKTQKDLVKKAYNLLNSGGTLVYSTCSILNYENEEIIDYAEKLGFELTTDFIKIFPNELFEGFFIAKLRKK